MARKADGSIPVTRKMVSFTQQAHERSHRKSALDLNINWMNRLRPSGLRRRTESQAVLSLLKPFDSEIPEQRKSTIEKSNEPEPRPELLSAWRRRDQRVNCLFPVEFFFDITASPSVSARISRPSRFLAITPILAVLGFAVAFVLCALRRWSLLLG